MPPHRNHNGGVTAPLTLSERIQQRIAKRLGCRIRQLVVKQRGKSVRIEGECSTYYTKQLAQHAALGAIDDENLVNALEVAIRNPR
ncbi:hypothetical protein Mal64_37960 [Pseudobythopirellula maris]|uniref:BON domain-containing protein n=1 Tax=Pseudobythopirellula maris TaxID=2527991 RepID=A0A5C5ZGB3_9BACT|nr:hypothetical protein [Pseudobythopirellula maris]TWT86256.1 hypothetical protein Mal64_37960 [Pseudobythopirellula maris]